MTGLSGLHEALPTPLLVRVTGLVDEWSKTGGVRRLWDRDASLWTSAEEERWLGWLTVVDRQLDRLGALGDFAAQIRGRFTHAALLGMGGSSLCPEVLSMCSGPQEGCPELRAIDSTVPAQVRAAEDSLPLESTLFLSASKSGSTLETALLTDYFLDRLSAQFGSQRAASQFVAITDPGSRLEHKARQAGFGHVFHGEPHIGGRYSALSDFGIVPAAVMGLDLSRLLNGAKAMMSACGPDVPPAANPGVRLGLLLGAAALAGRDKLTLVTSPEIASLGAWIEQLVAESTGKLGKGIVPVDGERLGEPSDYTSDRVFAVLDLESGQPAAPEPALESLADAGHPVIRVSIGTVEDLGQEFFRWELATAVAGAVLGINPFDQPDVESAKVAARDLTATYEADGSLPSDEPFFAGDGVLLYATEAYAQRLVREARASKLPSLLRAHITAAGDGDYLALLAFIDRNPVTVGSLARMREAIRSRSTVATCVGFGPRFLHSTGQLHKGGADNGVFLQIGCADGPDLEVPGRDLTFGVVKDAQALGDFQVLSRLGRRALRVQIDGSPTTGLARLEAAIHEALQ